MILQPRSVILPIIDIHCRPRNLQWPKSIYHYGQLIGPGFSDTGFIGPGMGSVGNTRRMKGYITLAYIVPAHKIAIHIIQYLIGIYIGMVIRCRYGAGVIIVQSGDEGTYHKGRGLKSLVYWWGLVHTPRNRFKIMDRKSVRIIIAVPPYHIKRMRGIDKMSPCSSWGVKLLGNLKSRSQ